MRMDNMPKKGITTAVILILIGVAGYLLAEKKSVTAFIPAFAGVPILLSSLIGFKNLKLGMHLAAVFGLLGFIAPLGRLIPVILKGEFALNLASGSQILMTIVCGFFLFQCIQSFKAARKARQAG